AGPKLRQVENENIIPCNRRVARRSGSRRNNGVLSPQPSSTSGNHIMHNLEQLIVAWRNSMTKLGVGSKTLDELESHLRETVNQLVHSGTSETEAFRRAATQLGTPPLIASEFRKLNSSTWLPVKLAIGLGILLAVAQAGLLAGRALSPLLKIHVW